MTALVERHGSPVPQAAAGRPLHRHGGRGEPVRARDACPDPARPGRRRGRRGRHRSPRRASRALGTSARDLAVVDGSLPDGSGIALVRELRALGWTRGVVLSSTEDPYTVRAALGAGVRAFLVTAASAGTGARAGGTPSIHRPSPRRAAHRRRGPLRPRGRGPPARLRRPVQQGDRRGPRPVRPHREEPPGPDRPQARHRRPRRDGRRRHARRRRRLTPARPPSPEVGPDARPTGRYDGHPPPPRTVERVTATEPAEPTEAAATAEAAAGPGVTAVPLTEPRDGVPTPLTDPDELARVVKVLAAGSGPVAVDAERASGYRYGQAAYLVQLRRADLGTVLIDPRALPDLSALGAAIAGDEWVLHAASQDLPCLAELGLRPTRVFDTELAGRLLGYPKVGLGSMVEEVLGLSLEKGHSAADWSTRPLPEPWLRYAALDVEVLVELRDLLAEQLDEQGKRVWAEEEFAAIVAAPPGAAQGRPLAPHVGHAPGPQAPPARRRAQPLGAPRRGRPPTRHRPRPGRCRTAPSSPPHWPSRGPRTTWSRCRSGAVGRCAGRPRSGCPPSPRRWSCRTRSCRTPRHRTRARPRPGPGRTATRWRRPGCPPRGPRSARSPSVSAAGREPARPGHRPPAVLVAARRPAGRGRGGRRPTSPRRPPLAGRAHRNGARRRDRRRPGPRARSGRRRERRRPRRAAAAVTPSRFSLSVTADVQQPATCSSRFWQRRCCVSRHASV